MKTNKITACLVIYNEEKVLERCLKSIKPVVDEIIVVHDGKCTDTSLKIAKKYGAKIYIRKHIGEAEYHRPFAFKKATGDWVLHIDADEYLSSREVGQIPNLVQIKEYSAYEFLWPYYNHFKNEFLLNGPYSRQFRMCLYKKVDMYMLGMTHYHPKTTGEVKRITDLTIYHIPNKTPLSMSEYRRKIIGWSKVYVTQVNKIKELPYFGYKSKTEITLLECKSIEYPLLKMFLEPIRRVFWFVKNGGLFCDPFNYKILFFDLSHKFFMYYYLYKLMSLKPKPKVLISKKL